MRRFRWLLICCLTLLGPRAVALDFFGDVLYWQATEPVDWTLNTNASATDQWVSFNSVSFDFSAGLRVGFAVELENEWTVKSYYTRFNTTTENTAAGLLTPMFFGGRSAVPTSLDPPFFQSGSIQTVVDYNVIDLDFNKTFQPMESLKVRPVLGLRAAVINQTFDANFQGAWSVLDIPIWKTTTEHVKNDFLGIGPKLGLENELNLWTGENARIDCTLNFYTAYLLGFWSFQDIAFSESTLGQSTYVVPIDDRSFGAVTFQAMVGVHLQYGQWSVTAGYEINDWLNQCQIFDDATGPHNNDLIVQGLSVRFNYSY